ncbi:MULTISPECIES: hypothetical protein [Salinibaculum]|uniref:hypothetical protein n=1 Tax=Salinibaculum TaxID=2732368 RepID=UPI0030CD77D2
MKQCPETPALEETESFSGHVWVEELPTGGEFRFQVSSAGLVTFATPERTYDSREAVPLPYWRAADAISTRLDRQVLQAARSDPGAVTFCGVAPWNAGIAYPWDAVPAFVGVDVWDEATGSFLPPDRASSVFQRIGLSTLPAIEKELQTAHTDLTRFETAEAFPESAWRDGQAVGVLIRDKSGMRAQAWRREPTPTASQPEITQEPAATLAESYVTTNRIEQTVAALRDSGQSVTVDGIRDRLIADIAREAYSELYSDGEFIASLSAFRSRVGERVQQHQFDTGE